MAKATRTASRRAATTPTRSAPVSEAASPPAGVGHNGGLENDPSLAKTAASSQQDAAIAATPAPVSPTIPSEGAPAAPTEIEGAPEAAPTAETARGAAKPGKVRWLKMETGLSGPKLSLTRGDKHPFCDMPREDDGPSEAQRLIDAGFAVECDPPAEG